MSEIVISVDQVGKQYQLGSNIHGTLRSALVNLFKKKEKIKPFNALNNISFELNKGDILGVIGKNGAGKSTLLKILSKITAPSSGRIEIKGRVSSLLEVGTGFHPELTGRENIFLNGTLLGMTRKEIDNKFEEIIDFSGIADFIDTPVKRYSSGMYVRLAFAVAAHLEPEILIIDEVLAVGDYEFQKKSLGKMEEVASKGRTVIFVSHNLAAVRNLCTRCILLEKGEISINGTVDEVIEKYQDINNSVSKLVDLTSGVTRNSSAVGEILFREISFENQPYKFGENIKFEILLRNSVQKLFKNLEIAVGINDKNENRIIHLSNKYINVLFDHKADSSKYTFEIENVLRPGRYQLVLFLRNNHNIQDWITGGIYFDIGDGNPYNFNNTSDIQGAIMPMFNFSQIG